MDKEERRTETGLQAIRVSPKRGEGGNRHWVTAGEVTAAPLVKAGMICHCKMGRDSMPTKNVTEAQNERQSKGKWTH